MFFHYYHSFSFHICIINKASVPHNGHVDRLLAVFSILKIYLNAFYNHIIIVYNWKDPFYIRLHN